MPARTPTQPDDTELRSETPQPGQEARDRAASSAEDQSGLSNGSAGGPVSFIPREPIDATVRPEPVRIRTGRYGELGEHELLQLLEGIEDERARARFRESIYISVFIWMAIAFLALYGPKYLWHAPKVVLPSEVLRERDQLLTLNAPKLSVPRVRTPPPVVDSHTLEHLRATEPKLPVPAPRPVPPTPAPTPRAETQPTPPTPSAPAPHIAPATAPPNLPSAPPPQPKPVPRTPAPNLPSAPPPQPNFNAAPRSPSDAMQNLLRNARPGTAAPGGYSNGGRGGSDLGMGGAEILSDTQGVNFNPYLQRILREIYDQWIPLIPEEARPPLRKSGITAIRFTILPDGTIGGMWLDDSTHDDALNKAAWGSITGVGQFPPLPSQFHGPNLELRIHYLVNRDTE